MSEGNNAARTALESLIIPSESHELVLWFKAAFPASYKMNDDLILTAIPSEVLTSAEN